MPASRGLEEHAHEDVGMAPRSVSIRPLQSADLPLARRFTPGTLPMSDDLAFAPLTVLGAKLRSGEVSAVELARFFLDRLERFGPRYNAVARLARERAREEARRADEELKAGRDRGPLHGIPYGAKDLLATRGIPT